MWMMASGYDQRMREELPVHRMARLVADAKNDRTIPRAREQADDGLISGMSFALLVLATLPAVVAFIALVPPR
jgi:hypothetical protein